MNSDREHSVPIHVSDTNMYIGTYVHTYVCAHVISVCTYIRIVGD